MRRLTCTSLFCLALLQAPGAALADAFETFYLDPAQSFMTFEAGNITTQVSSTIFPSSSLTPQSGGGQAALSGEFLLHVVGDLASPTSLGVLPGLSEIHLADANPVSPGAAGAAGTTEAAFGFSFLDGSGTGLSGDLAVHDLVFGIDGVFSVFANGLGPNGFSGDLNWTLAGGTTEVATNIGIGGTLFLPLATSFNDFVISSQSQLGEIAPGVYEMVMPFSMILSLGPIDSGPFTNTNVGARFSGTIVATNAVPEPGSSALLALGLVAIAARRRMGGGR